MKSTMQIELKDLGCVTRDLLAEMKKLNHRLEATKKDSMKPEELFDFREEDYEDFNQISQQYLPYQKYLYLLCCFTFIYCFYCYLLLNN